MNDTHRCRDCPGCACGEPRCGATCDWDCECPQYPPPEVQVLAELAAEREAAVNATTAGFASITELGGDPR
jgi:hypothetical protein